MSEPSSATPARGARGEIETVELSPAAQSQARRVAEAKATIPHVYFQEPLIEPAPLPSLVVACAEALTTHRALNGAYRDGHLELRSRINIALAVDADDTLAFPVIHDAESKSAAEVEAELGALADGARSGSLAAPAFAGATFTIIDFAPAGVSVHTPTVPPGQAACLGAGTTALTLACDNRAVQASEGGVFLRAVSQSLGRNAGTGSG